MLIATCGCTPKAGYDRLEYKLTLFSFISLCPTPFHYNSRIFGKLRPPWVSIFLSFNQFGCEEKPLNFLLFLILQMYFVYYYLFICRGGDLGKSFILCHESPSLCWYPVGIHGLDVIDLLTVPLFWHS